MLRIYGLLMTLALLLCACTTTRPLVVAATPTPMVPSFCKLHVDGRWVKDDKGNIVVLHGADLPTLKAMEASDRGRKPEDRLRELANAGARVVRLTITQDELTPTFVPAKLSPFIDQANALGMLVILVYHNDTQETVDTQADSAEDWLRIALTYLRNAPGVWFEPFDTPIDTPKWQALNQRMVDVVRGFRADNVVVINNPAWLKKSSAIATSLLNGSNIVYGVDRLDGWPLDAAPFILTLTKFGSSDLQTVQAAQVWSIAVNADLAAGLSSLWMRSQMCQ